MEQLGLITVRVESGLLTAHLIMAHDTFRPMARVDTKAHNFIGPNRPEIYFGLLTARPIWDKHWALGSFGMYWLVNFSTQL